MARNDYAWAAVANVWGKTGGSYQPLSGIQGRRGLIVCDLYGLCGIFLGLLVWTVHGFDYV